MTSQAAQFAHASGTFDLTVIVFLLPLVSAAILLLVGRRGNRWGHVLGCLAPIASFVLALIEFAALLGKHASQRSYDQHLFSWIPVNSFHVDLNLLVDPLSICFVLLITGVGSLIHVYSVGYMAHDPGRRRYFGYLNLFVAAMLLLVLADSYLTLYVGWEGVGLASYLLIGFWYHKPSAATAAKKAFVVNRVGDLGLSLAIMLMFTTFGSTSFRGVLGVGAHAPQTHPGTLTAIGLLLMLGACGKSAQFPLQTWLPDAMEGPTPVSALIHAATMVTAGVYLVGRSAPIFNASPNAQLVVASIGVLTLMIGGIIGCAYDDIKRVIAYSTVSQIGYMMLGVGLGPIGYAAGIFHLLAHGFFKAEMFLSAGSVMHGMNDQVDMRRFGGLRKVMPVTFVCMTAGYLALIGFPGFSGFWTKDRIIEAAFNRGGVAGPIFGWVALIGVVFTAYYATRMMVMTFFGERRWTADVEEHPPHESPKVMTWPMLALAVGSAAFGAVFLFAFKVEDFLAPVLGRTPEGAASFSPLVLSLIGIAAMVGGAAAAIVQYHGKRIPTEAPTEVSPLTVAARENLYADAFNEAVLMRPGQYLTRALVFFDGRGVDGAVNGTAALVGGSSGRLRRVQTGFVRSYALSMLFGVAVVAAALLILQAG